MNISPEIKKLPEQHVAYISHIGDYRGKPEVFATIFKKLFAWAGSKNLIDSSTLTISAYNNDPGTTPPDELSLDGCVTVPEDVEVEGEVKKKKLPGGNYAVASLELTGPEQYEEAWTALVTWMNNNGYEMDTESRPWYEIYKNNPEEHPEGHHILDMCGAIK